MLIRYPRSTQISQKQDGRNIYAIMKIMCPPYYHCNGFVATNALYTVCGLPKYMSCNKTIVAKIVWANHCFYD